jgi:hypothetical protein
MAADYRDLNRDETFWKTEKQITQVARGFIHELAAIKAFDFFRVKPESYNVKEDDTGTDQKAATAVPSKVEKAAKGKGGKGSKSAKAPAKGKLPVRTGNKVAAIKGKAGNDD